MRLWTIWNIAKSIYAMLFYIHFSFTGILRPIQCFLLLFLMLRFPVISFFFFFFSTISFEKFRSRIMRKIIYIYIYTHTLVVCVSEFYFIKFCQI